MARIAQFLRHVLRDTRLPLAGLICAMGVDGIRPRGTCGTHFSQLAITLFFGSFLLCGLGGAFALSRVAKRRVAEAIVATGLNVYSCALSLYLCLPYAPSVI